MNEEVGNDGKNTDGWKVYKGMEGIPFRSKGGQPPLVKSSDPDHIQPTLTHDVKVKVYDLTDEKQLEEYTEMLQFCVSGKGRILDRFIEFDKLKGNWKVFVSWAAYYWENPSENNNDRKQYT